MGSFSDRVLGQQPADDNVDASGLIAPETVTPVRPEAPAPTESGLARRVLGESDIESRIQFSATSSTKTSPDRAARILEIQDKTRLPIDLIQRNFETVDAAAKTSDFDPVKFRKESPVVASWMAEAPEHASIVMDDMTALSKTERIVRALVRGHATTEDYRSLIHTAGDSFPGRVYQLQAAQYRLNTLGAREIDGEVLTPEEEREASDLISRMGELNAFGKSGLPWAGKLIASGAIQYARGIYNAQQLGVMGATGAGAAALAGGVSAPATPAIASAGYAFGLQLGLLKETYRMEAGGAYYEFLQVKGEDGKPIDKDVAKAAARVVGALNAPLELLTIRSLVKTIPGGARVLNLMTKDWIKSQLERNTVRSAIKYALKKLTKTGAENALQEGSQELVTILAGEAAKSLSPGQFQSDSLWDNAKRVGESALGGAVMGVGLGLPGTLLQVNQDFARARKASQNEAMFKALGDAVKESKTFQKLPTKTQELVSSMTRDGAIETLYVPSDSFQTYWQEQGIEPRAMARDILGDTKAYDEAVAAGTDIPIPTAVYATKIAPTDHNAFFQAELRTTPDAMNARESNEFMRIVDEAASAADKGALPERALLVSGDIQTQLVAAGFDERTAENYSTLYGHAFNSLGERTGQDPFALYKRYGLKISRSDSAALGSQEAASVLSQEEIRPEAGVQPQSASARGQNIPASKPLGSEQAGIQATGAAQEGLPVHQPGPERAESVYRLSVPFDPSITSHPNFRKFFADADSVVRKYASLFGQDITPEFSLQAGETIHQDLRAAYTAATPELRAAAAQAVAEKYKGMDMNQVGSDMILLRQAAQVVKGYSEQGKQFMNEFVKQKLDSYTDEMRVKTGIEAESSSMTADTSLSSTAKVAGQSELFQGAMERELMKGPARAVFHGWFEAPEEFGGSFPVYNIRGQHDRYGSTVGRGTLESLGIEIPNTPTLAEWKNAGSKVTLEQPPIRNIVKQTDTPEFKKWFGASEVVDSDGQPLVVYHGTHAQERFNIFDPDATGKNTDYGWLGTGMYFTPYPGQAELYAKADTKNPAYPFTTDVPDNTRIMPVFLKAENPYKTDRPITHSFSQELRERGHDAIFWYDEIDNGVPREILVFSSEQIKSATGNRGTFDAGSKNILEQAPADNAPIFYSQLQRIIEAKMPNTAPVDQVRNIIKGGAVKQDEIEWSGIEDFLTGKVKVSKADLLDFLRSNEVKIQEVVKGRGISKEEQARLDVLRDASNERDLSASEMKEYDALAVKEEQSVGKADSTKFAQYQLPGGENYREVLLTLPIETKLPEGWSVRNDPEYGWIVESKGGETIQGSTKEEAIANARQRLMNNRHGTGDVFRSSHFEEPNILAHVRLNDRTTSDGKKMLFLEEVQSDWHQKGRDKGYRKGEIPRPEPITITGVTEREYDFMVHFSNGDNRGVGKGTLSGYGNGIESNKEGARAYFKDILEEDNRRVISEWKEGVSSLGDVPNAPFKKTWHELALKRMLRYAVDNGYDAIGWTTGEQQAERYDLSKQVDKISVPMVNKDNRSVRIDASNGTSFKLMVSNDGVVDGSYSGGQFSGKRLDEVVGKEMAKKIMELTSPKDFTGLDLKVGGEGMEGFYDQMIPSFLNKYTKKWGGRVGESVIHVTPKKVKFSRDAIASVEAHDNLGFDTAGEALQAVAIHDDFATRWEILNPEDVKVLTDWKNSQGAATIHSLEITPSIRESVKQGQPLFQRKGNEARGRIMFGSDRQFSIELLKNADLSTFLHETGHFFLEVMGDISEANADIKADMDEILKFMDVKSREEIGREQHEQFARAFESYLMEGKAPSAGLRQAFARFRAWLIAVYRSVVNLNVDLTPEVRGVFDRLVATKGEIGEAEVDTGLSPLFSDAKAMGMTDAQAQSYAEAVAEARDASEEELSTRVLRDFNRERRRVWNEARERFKAAAEEEVNQRKEQIALSALQRGKFPGGEDLPVEMSGIKLSKKAIVEQFGEERLRTLPKPYVYSADGGMHPDMAAEIFGFSSGDELMTAITTATPRKQLIDAMTTERMRAEFGDVLMDGRIPEEAVKAVHNQKRARLLQMELEYLASNNLPVVKGIVRRMSQRIPPLEAVTAQAEKTIASKSIRNMFPSAYRQAESRAAREATAAMLRGDFSAALSSKQKELLNHELFTAATRAVDETDSIISYLKRFDKPSVRERLGKAGGDYLDQIDSLLERYDFRRGTTLKEIDRRKSLAEWVEEQRAQGQDVDVPKNLINDAMRKHYKDASFEELQGLRDSVKMIAHLARVKSDLLANERLRTLEAARDEIVASISAHHTVTQQPIDFAPSLSSRMATKAREGVAAHTRMEFLFQFLDGNKPNGATWQTLFKPMVDAENKENEMIHAAGKDLRDIFSAYSRKERIGWFMKKTFIPEIGTSMNHANMLAVALNWGNEYNRQALMDGYGWTDGQVNAILSKLDDRDWDTVQKVWDHIDSYWPKIEAMEQQLNGVAPAKVDRSAFVVGGADGIPGRVTQRREISGGYYPIVFDSQLSWRQSNLEEAANVQDMFGGNWARAMTKKGHTIARKGTGGKPVLLQLTGLTRHITNVIHDLSFRPSIIDASKIIRHPDVRLAIEGSAGREMYRQLNPWLMAIAGDRRGEPMNPIEGLLGRARAGVTTVALGLKLSSGIIQTMGYLNTINEVGFSYAGRGLRDAFSRPTEIMKSWRFITDRSEMMRSRIENYDRDVRDAMQKLSIEGASSGIVGAVDAYTKDVRNSFFSFIGLMDLATSVPTWLAGYHKAMDGNVENITAGDERGAIDYADSVVRKTQSAGAAKDLASIQRGSETFKIFTMFYSQLSLQFNMMASAVQGYRLDKNMGRLVGAAALLWFIPAVMEDVLRARLPDSDDDPEKWAAWFARNQALYPFNTVVLVRDLANSLESYLESGRKEFSGSPVFDVGQSIVGLASLVTKPATGEDVSRSDIKNAAMAAGYVFQLPTRQTWQTVEYLYDWMTGDQSPSNPAEGVWRALVVGKKRE